MKFNNILPPQSTQKDVFFLVEDSIRQFLKGINTTIFAYGQTGTGKTHTMTGVENDEEHRGIMPRAFEDIFKCIKGDSNQT